MIICPCCGKEVEPEHFSCKSGEKGGSSGKGVKKARTREQAQKAADARWHRKIKIDVPSLTIDSSGV
jgi:hypothetical protein